MKWVSDTHCIIVLDAINYIEKENYIPGGCHLERKYFLKISFAGKEQKEIITYLDEKTRDNMFLFIKEILSTN